MDAQGLCAAYAEVKRFDKVFPCARALDPYVARDDVSVVGFDFGFELGVVGAHVHALTGMKEPFAVAQEHPFRTEPRTWRFVDAYRIHACTSAWT